MDKKKRTPGDQQVGWPKAEEASRAVREYLTAFRDAAQNHAESSEDRRQYSNPGSSRRKRILKQDVADRSAGGMGSTVEEEPPILFFRL